MKRNDSGKARSAKPKPRSAGKPAAGKRRVAADSPPKALRPKRSSTPIGGRSIAVTGAFGFLGRRLLARLEADPSIERILALDVKPPPGQLRKTVFERIDLASPRADVQAAQALRDAKVDTLVHLALFFNPIQNAAYAHEVEVIGTLQLLSAADLAKVSAIVACGSTMLYGANPDNPNYLREDQPLRPPAHSRYLADKLQVELQLATFAKEHPRAHVSVLRLGPILGPTVKNLATQLFGRPLVPVVLGRDPLLQFLHEDDASEALFQAVLARPNEPLNIVPPGVLPLSSVLRILGRTPLPLPAPVAQSGLGLLWSMFGVGTPPSWLDFLRYLWVADGTRATELLGLKYRYTTRETVLAFGQSGALAASGLGTAALPALPSADVLPEVAHGA